MHCLAKSLWSTSFVNVPDEPEAHKKCEKIADEPEKRYLENLRRHVRRADGART